MSNEIIPLAMISPGQKGTVVCTKDYGSGLLKHMSDMGLSEGSEVKVITAGGPGPYLIGVKETCLAIGQGMANKILVRKDE